MTIPNKRFDRFMALKEHPFHSRAFAKLRQTDIELARLFLVQLGESPTKEFSLAVNRWFVDDPNKPKSHSLLWGLMTNVVSEEFSK